MTASNHIVTGALIAAVLPQPLIAIPLAFMSHFVLDSLPHYGHESDDRYWMTRGYTRVLAADILFSLILIGSLLYIQPTHWLLILVCGVVAVLPDALWLPYYLHDRKHSEPKKRRRLEEMLKKIQWGERPWGIYVELVWLVIIGVLLIGRL